MLPLVTWGFYARETCSDTKKGGAEMAKQSVAVDLDGVLAQYDGWKGVGVFGEVVPGAKEFLEALHQAGYHIVIHTTRVSGTVNPIPDDWEKDRKLEFNTRLTNWRLHLAALVMDWLSENRLRFDEVWSRPGKPSAVAYVDDHSVLCIPKPNNKAQDNIDYAYAYAFGRVLRLAAGLDESNTVKWPIRDSHCLGCGGVIWNKPIVEAHLTTDEGTAFGFIHQTCIEPVKQRAAAHGLGLKVGDVEILAFRQACRVCNKPFDDGEARESVGFDGQTFQVHQGQCLEQWHGTMAAVAAKDENVGEAQVAAEPGNVTKENAAPGPQNPPPGQMQVG